MRMNSIYLRLVRKTFFPCSFVPPCPTKACQNIPMRSRTLARSRRFARTSASGCMRSFRSCKRFGEAGGMKSGQPDKAEAAGIYANVFIAMPSSTTEARLQREAIRRAAMQAGRSADEIRCIAFAGFTDSAAERRSARAVQFAKAGWSPRDIPAHAVFDPYPLVVGSAD